MSFAGLSSSDVSPLASSALELVDLGITHYQEARSIQEQAVKLRIAGEIPDTLILCEHHPCVTLGKNMSVEESALLEASIASYDVPVIRTSRGGKASFHVPGQLVVYPVIHLRDRRLGIREFVCLGLEALASVVETLGVSSRTSLTAAGVWVGERKVASVGLAVDRGVTNHGFSLNVDCSLDITHAFRPCGLDSRSYENLKNLLGHELDRAEVSAAVYREFTSRLGSSV